jgi:hypothetical protein
MTKVALVIVGVSLAGALACGSSAKNAADGAAGVGGSAGTGGSDDGSAGTGGSAGAGGSAGSEASGAAGGTSGMGGADGGGVDTSADAAAPTDGSTAAAMNATSAGGTLTFGEVVLAIPAGALSADTAITMTTSIPADTLPDRSSLAGMVYDIGPNGTTFAKPVALTLPLAMSAPAGKGAVVSWLDTSSNSWMDLATTVNGNTVVAQTTHFTLFAVRWVTGASACAFGGGCAGSLAGTWDLTDACIAKAAKDVNEICGMEDTNSFVTATGGSGTLTVTGAKYTLAVKAAIRAVYSSACLTRAKLASCAAVEAALVTAFMVTPTCTGSTSTACDCSFLMSLPDESGTVSASNQLVRDMDPAGETQVSDACAKNGTVQIRSTKTNTAAGMPPVVSVTVYSGKPK